MSNIQHLKRLEYLQTENKQLTDKLSELAVVIARLKLAGALAALRPATGRNRKMPATALGSSRSLASARQKICRRRIIAHRFALHRSRKLCYVYDTRWSPDRPGRSSDDGAQISVSVIIRQVHVGATCYARLIM
jgi:hypothetical protein